MADEQKYIATEYGQLAMFSQDSEQKVRGSLIDEVMSREITTQVSEFSIEDRALPEPSLPVETRVMLCYEGVEVDGKVQLNDIDREVIDAVATLSLYNDYFTAQMVFKVMAGKRSGQYRTPAQRQLVVDSMRKCMFSSITIRLPDVVIETDSGRKVPAQTTFEGPMLSFDRVTVKTAKDVTDYYKIHTKPALFKYAQSIGKVSEFPMEMLDTPPSKTKRIILAQSYLLRTIDAMNRDEMPESPIPWREIQRRGEWGDGGNTVMRMRKQVLDILEHWKQYRFLLGYKADKSINGTIRITPNRDFPKYDLADIVPQAKPAQSRVQKVSKS